MRGRATLLHSSFNDVWFGDRTTQKKTGRKEWKLLSRVNICIVFGSDLNGQD